MPKVSLWENCVHEMEMPDGSVRWVVAHYDEKQNRYSLPSTDGNGTWFGSLDYVARQKHITRASALREARRVYPRWLMDH